MKRYFKRGWNILLDEGVWVLLQRIGLRLGATLGLSYYGNFDRGYHRWIAAFDQPLSEPEAQQIYAELGTKPTFSIIVPVYKVAPQWLQQTLESVVHQSYPHWQLCVVDDASANTEITQLLKAFAQSDSRISLSVNQANLGISETSNRALGVAQGEFVALLDHDDVLARDALLHNARIINEQPEVDLIYSDEDKISSQGKRHTPFFKPDFSPELLHCQNYIGHFVVIRKSLVERIGGFRPAYDGSQDYDLVLRAYSAKAKIKHIAKILYHWREIPGSTAAIFDAKSYAHQAGQKALTDHFDRLDLRASVEKGTYPGTYRPRFEITDTPTVSMVLPFKDQPTLLDKCLQSIFTHSQWPHIEIIAIDNNSEQEQTQRIREKWQKKHEVIRFIDFNQDFNYSKICNFAVNECTGKFIVLINSDIEITSPHWIESQLAYAQQSAVGAVGAKLFYPNHTIQHAGIVVGIDGGAGHPYKHFPSDHRGYFLRLGLTHNVSAVTGALMMVEKRKYLEVGGLDESEFAIAYNDVDFCLKLMQAGFRNTLVTDCTAIHHESSSRGYDQKDNKRLRHDQEKQKLWDKWKDYLDGHDPYYNPNLTVIREDHTLNFQKKPG